jgi:anti-sigma B factor antagonist
MAKRGSMTIETEVENKTTAVLKLSGRLDTANAPILEQKIKQWGDGITELILDFEDVEYISSMGLRVLLSAKKASREKNRQFVIRRMNDIVREVFEMTGFINLIVREEGFAVVRRDEDGGETTLFLNGELAPDGVPAVTAELSKIKVRLGDSGRRPVVVLDMSKLYFIMPGALRQLKQALDETDWEGRRILVRNVPPDYNDEVKACRLGEAEDDGIQGAAGRQNGKAFDK